MTQEDKELLLKDLCTRLPYGIKCKDQYGEYINVNIYNAHLEHLVGQISSSVVQMVLRPMSSMTEEEYKEYSKLWDLQDEFPTDADIRFKIDVFDWLNAHHFDYRGLIEKGLAISVTEKNNPYKEQNYDTI